jgi:hypothetical protein
VSDISEADHRSQKLIEEGLAQTPLSDVCCRPHGQSMGGKHGMGLDNVAVRWPRTGDFYDSVTTAEFGDFADMADRIPESAQTATALARTIATSATAPVSAYTGLVDLLLGLNGVLYATEAAEEDEDPVIDPDGCAWIAGGLERFVTGHREQGRVVTFESVGAVLHGALEGSRLAEQQLAWLQSRLDALRDERGNPPPWDFPLAEIAVLATFYRRCADRGFAVFARS